MARGLAVWWIAWWGAGCSQGTVGVRAKSEVPAEPRSDLLQDEPELERIWTGDAVLSQGGAPEATARVQQALYDLAFLNGVDGDFGPATEHAIEELQAEMGLDQHGEVDQVTLLALDAMHSVFPSRRFHRQPVWTDVRIGDGTLAQGSDDLDAVTTLQATLYSLGYDLGDSWVDGDFGAATTSAVAAFQGSAGLPVTGEVDAATLAALDEAARSALESWQREKPEEGSKAPRYELWADIAPRGTVEARAAGLEDDAPMVLWVIDLETGAPVDGYLTSPGKSGHETQGDQFTVLKTMPRAWWYPGESYAGSPPQPPGLDNPMGILKLHFVEYLQAIHGTPRSVWSKLGTPASSGCLRVSGVNILDLHERYAESGTEVFLTRDPLESLDLWARAEAAGIVVADIEKGRELIGPYVGAELGRDEEWTGSALFTSLDPDAF